VLFESCAIFLLISGVSDVIILLQELMKENMLSVLHQKELGKEEVLHYVSQVSEGMNYLHQQSVLHCDLAARNISFSLLILLLGLLVTVGVS